MRRFVLAVLAGAVALLGLLLLSPTAALAAGETVQGRLRNGTEGVAGVTISVATAEGSPVGTGQSDAEGRFTVPVPGPGNYTVTLQEDTLPEGVDLSEGVRGSVPLVVNSGQQRNVLFPLGAGRERATTSDLERTVQLAVEGLNFGLIIALAAVGLSLIYGTTGLVNFAHGELITLGGLLAYLFNATLGLPFLLAALLAVVGSALLGGAQDRVLWRPLRSRGTGLIAMLVVTIGLALFARGAYLYVFGGSSRPYDAYRGQVAKDYGLFSLTTKDIFSIIICTTMLLLFAFMLLRTRIGKATRAVADNPALAASSGIDVERVIATVWIAGGGLAGLAGVMLGLSQQVSYQMGFQILLLVFASVTLGGLGTAFGALLGSLVVGVFTQVSTLVVPTELKNAGALVILIVILLVRPQGILGRRERVG
ncbi:MAG TPA: branched-chain amino acid ABC transporter permease [Mycobacteriales bacterium]|nr:branched-chain amino acid ABC transporter permease [Mycobacteriales bacterium]